MDANELVSIGRIVGTHGYKGMLKVMPLTDFPERFQGLAEIRVYRDVKFPGTELHPAVLTKTCCR